MTGNVTGAARTILTANILGASCARVCPTEVLCEGACVMLDRDNDPIKIGRLQRYATDHVSENADFSSETDSAKNPANASRSSAAARPGSAAPPSSLSSATRW